MQDKTHKINYFREAMANYPTGVSIVTATDESNTPFGLTVNSFASVSLDPLLILWSIDNNASTYDKFMEIDKFTVNILAENQAEIASVFASSKEDRFENCEWYYSEHNLPIISEAMASLQCNVFNKIEAGDHIILIGEIFHIHVEEKAPLLYHQRKLGAFPAVFHEE